MKEDSWLWNRKFFNHHCPTWKTEGKERIKLFFYRAGALTLHSGEDTWGPLEGFRDWWEALEQGTLRSPSSTSGLNPRTGVGGGRRKTGTRRTEKEKTERKFHCISLQKASIKHQKQSGLFFRKYLMLPQTHLSMCPCFFEDIHQWLCSIHRNLLLNSYWIINITSWQRRQNQCEDDLSSFSLLFREMPKKVRGLTWSTLLILPILCPVMGSRNSVRQLGLTRDWDLNIQVWPHSSVFLPKWKIFK